MAMQVSELSWGALVSVIIPTVVSSREGGRVSGSLSRQGRLQFGVEVIQYMRRYFVDPLRYILT